MAITLDDLTVNFNHLNREALLEDWRWLIGPSKQPILLTALGDAFLQDPDDGSVHFLDAGAGELSEVVDSFEEFEGLLGDREFVTNYFLPGLIVNLRNAGKILDPGELYSYQRPPILGGECAVENFEPANIEVHFSITSRICAQAINLPEGTPIAQITIEER